MLYNTFVFAVFFIIVYSLYVTLSHKWQNRMLLLASYFFYGWWDWRFLSLLWFSTAVDYVTGLKLASTESPRARKAWLAGSIIIHLSVLGFFKYCNFFVDTFAPIVTYFGLDPASLRLNIILPAGISFYTFQTMSYTIDIYRGQSKPTRNIIDFALYLAYFPQLVAGPIERSTRLLPMIQNPRTVTALSLFEGMHLIAWGIFKKVVVADNLAKTVDFVFNPAFTGNANIGCWTVMLGTVAFAFQIYCDFSGYTDIGRGCAKMMGIDLMLNFNLPYFASSIRDFWRRWHISLSSWLRDYLYIPLGGNRYGKLATYRNIFITFLLGGLWHGASWTFVFWGAYQGILLSIHRVFYDKVPDLTWHDAQGARGKSKWVGLVAFNFAIACFGWILFRAKNMEVLGFIMQRLVQWEPLKVLADRGPAVVLYILPLLIVEAFQYFKRELDWLLQVHWALRGVAYASIIYGIIIWGAEAGKTFIYFQF